MSNPYRPLKNLYHQFIKGTDLDGVLSWEHVASALSDADLITLVVDKDKEYSFSGYRETDKMKSIPESKFEMEIKHVLVQYALDQGLT